MTEQILRKAPHVYPSSPPRKRDGVSRYPLEKVVGGGGGSRGPSCESESPF